MHCNRDSPSPRRPSDSTSRRQSSWRPPPACPGSMDQLAPQELPPHTPPWLPRGPGGQDGRLCRVGVFSVFMPVSKYLICDQPTSWRKVKNDPKVPAACAIFRPGHLRKPSPHQAPLANHSHHHYHINHSALGTGDEFWKGSIGWRGCHFQSKNLCCRFWIFKQGFFRKKLQHDFLKMRGGGVKGRLELFRKLICFGSVTHPLPKQKSIIIITTVSHFKPI